MKHRSMSSLASSAISGAAIAFVAIAANAADTVSVRTDWFHSHYHSPFFLGMEKGFYREAGIELKPTEGRGSGQVVQLVGSGDDEFGFASTDAVFRAVAKEIPVIAVGNLMPKMGQAVYVLKKSGITRPEQLKGKTIAMTPGGTNEALLPAFLKNVGLSMADLRPITVSPAAKNRMFTEGKFDAVMSVAWAAGLFKAGGGTNSFVYSDYGVVMVGYNIVTRPEFAKANADVVRRFLKATMKAFAYSKRNQEEALDALAKHRPNHAKPDRRKRNIGDMADAMKFVGVAVKGKAMGYQSEKDWRATQELLLKYGVIKNKKPISTYFTNAYIGE